MKKFYYYARLNDNQICTEIVSRVDKLKDVQGYIEIANYNETLVYRKWDSVTHWSQETYEPSIDTVLQDKVEAFENLVVEQNNTITKLGSENVLLKDRVTELEELLASYIGGTK